jgi:hypothetical protein
MIKSLVIATLSAVRTDAHTVTHGAKGGKIYTLDANYDENMDEIVN